MHHEHAWNEAEQFSLQSQQVAQQIKALQEQYLDRMPQTTTQFLNDLSLGHNHNASAANALDVG